MQGGGVGAGRFPLTKESAFSKLPPSEGLKKNPPGPPSKEKETPCIHILSDPKLAIQGQHCFFFVKPQWPQRRVCVGGGL